MASHFNINVGIQRDKSTGTPRRRGIALCACALLIACVIFLLWLNLDFGRYAVSGFFWERAEGTVLSSGTTSVPTIQFAAHDGATHRFTEDYIILCGGRGSLCFIRDFRQGEVVPVVYDPSAPQKAFVDDWALSAGIITFFAEATGGMILVLMFAVLLRQRPLQLSLRLGESDSGFGWD